ncbi:zinc metalloproteinase nas-6 [Trichonephila clavipes]|nr:zinc metalloproteinase nas-6 [Trichonephila clavipes]
MENEGMFEGDIAGIDPYVLTDRNAVVDEAQIWPEGIVYYEIDWRLRKVKDIIQEAFDEYESKTCVRFKPKTAATKDYIKLTIVSGCWSSVGRTGGEQEISLSEGCHDKVSAVHEIGHALGLWHEHSRSDRDDYLDIIWSNIKPGNFFKNFHAINELFFLLCCHPSWLTPTGVVNLENDLGMSPSLVFDST